MPSARNTCLPLAAALLAAMIIVPAADAQRWRNVDPELTKRSPIFSDVGEEVLSPLAQSVVELLGPEGRVALATVVDDRGYLLTKLSEIDELRAARVPGGLETEARLVAASEDNDLALVRIDSPIPLRAVTWHDGGGVDRGQIVLSPRGVGRSPRLGIVSVLPRPLPGPGALLGVVLSRETELGVPVDGVSPNSGADDAGVRPGDIIAAVDGVAATSREALIGQLRQRDPGEEIDIAVVRGDESIVLKATLGSRARQSNRAQSQNRLGGRLSERAVGFDLALQHDTILEPEDAGGPLVDLDGRIVGINIARTGRVESYAIPAAEARELTRELLEAAQANTETTATGTD